ncbi:hypothetical protein BD413DRAFT_669527 [Trametes elegans]|nr:hypothetical protein BD413DRAFT_669527 [Trametes elegans]
MALQAPLAKHNTDQAFLFPYDYRPGGTYDLQVYPPEDDPLPPSPDVPDHPVPPPAAQVDQPQNPPPPQVLLPQLVPPHQIPPAQIPPPPPLQAQDNHSLWLWTVCNDVLDAALGPPPAEPGADLSEREAALTRFKFEHAPTYPARPTLDITAHPWAGGLRKMLAEAPPVPSELMIDIPDLVWHGRISLDIHEWSAAYLERLFKPLCMLMSTFRSGLYGWETLRWAVYDKYVQMFRRGIRYDQHAKTWRDDAEHWLDPYQYADGSYALGKSPRKQCALSLRFNQLLSVPPPAAQAYIAITVLLFAESPRYPTLSSPAKHNSPV